MADDAPSPTPAVTDDQGFILSDTTCLRCGYDLRALHRDGKCPECGADVALSLMGDTLQYGDPAWLATIARGLGWIVRALYVLFICSLVGVVFGTSSAVRASLGIFPFVILALGVAAGAAVALGIGLWRFTTAEPHAAGAGGIWQARIVARAFVVLTVMAVGTEIVFEWAGGGFVALLCLIAVELSACCCVLAILVYARGLALRIPDEREARTFRSQLFGFAALGGVILFEGLVTLARGSTGALRSLAGFDVWIGAVMIIAWSFNLARFRQKLEEVAFQALVRREAGPVRRSSDTDTGRPPGGGA